MTVVPGAFVVRLPTLTTPPKIVVPGLLTVTDLLVAVSVRLKLTLPVFAVKATSTFAVTGTSNVMKVFAVTLPVLKTADPPPPVPEAIRLPTLTVPLKFTGRKALVWAAKFPVREPPNVMPLVLENSTLAVRTTSLLKF